MSFLREEIARLRARVAELEAECGRLRAERDAITRAYVRREPGFRVGGVDMPEKWKYLLPVHGGMTSLAVDFKWAMSEAEAFAAIRQVAGLGADAPAHGPWGSVGASDFARATDAREAVEAANWRGLESGAPAAPGEGEVTP